MKFNFHVSPNIKNNLTTQQIMKELTCCLMVLFVLACVYYYSAYGARYALQAVYLLASSLITMFICEFGFAKIRHRDPKSEIMNSFGWVTSIILVLMVPISMRIYAIVIATAFAIIFGKMVFGGFGHNVFNPAAVGRAVIFASFTGATTDIVTSATPTTVLAANYQWLPSSASQLQEFLSQYGGWSSLCLGTYPGALGETFTIAIVLLGVYLIARRLIDWRVPVVYLATIFVMTMVVAILCGVQSYNGVPGFIWYPVINLLLGGVVFGGFFMLTDPVTSPTSPAGRTIFALGAGILTVLIRLTANLPEGCLYSILLMNMFSPMIESFFDGKQLEIQAKAKKCFVCFVVIALAISFFASTQVGPSATADVKNVSMEEVL